ncbi:MAG: hypothetical protein J6U84_07895 [Bacteroidales bacterium]|nr:hypothetical protein [Bacteroidales bacterium]
MKKILTLLVVATMSLSAFAQFQPPTKEINWFGTGKEYGDEGAAEEGTGIRREKSPIAPATLLLLGLGGAAVGTKVLRNTKK